MISKKNTEIFKYQEILQYYCNIGNIANTDIYWFVSDKILLVPALPQRRLTVHGPQ